MQQQRTTVISELDIYRAANLVLKRYGADAVIEAARMVDRMLELDDVEGRDLWRLPIGSIRALGLITPCCQ